MSALLSSLSFLPVFVSLLFFCLGTLLRRKVNHPIINPLLLSCAATVGFLLLTGVDYETYRAGAGVLSYLLTPTTVCLAVPLYEKLHILRHNYKAILVGICCGIAVNFAVVLSLAVLFRLSHTQYVTMLPKSITTAIGMSVSEELGGVGPLTAAGICVTGITANIIADLVFRLFRITEPVAKGIALGTSGHAIGTAKAQELGASEGAMSGLAIAVAGVLSVAAISVFAMAY